MFSYDPQDAISCFPAGEYEASIESVEEKTSSKGNPMLALELKAYGKSGSGTQTVFDWIVNPSTLFKLKALAKALGELKSFELAQFDPEQFIGKVIRVELSVESSAQYGDQNRIKKYIPKDEMKKAEPDAQSPQQEDDDDVPF